MTDLMDCPPIIFLVFNRPDLTERVFGSIRAQRPKQLYVVADGPRDNKQEDPRLCGEVRTIVSKVDWPCDVTFDFSDVNLGCARCVSSGISKAFEQFEEAIILEDDCLPHHDFYHFCKIVLERYAADERVMHISGTCFPKSSPCLSNSDETVYFSKYPFMWGWATWRRAWQHYDHSLEAWLNPSIRAAVLALMDSDLERDRWTYRYGKVLGNEVSTWAWRWQLSVWAQSGLTAVPTSNLITNLGFDDAATHTTSNQSWQSIPSTSLEEVRLPRTVLRDIQADRDQFENYMCERSSAGGPKSPSSLTRRFIKLLNKLLPK